MRCQSCSGVRAGKAGRARMRGDAADLHGPGRSCERLDSWGGDKGELARESLGLPDLGTD